MSDAGGARQPHNYPSRTTVPRATPLEWLFAKTDDYAVEDEVAEVLKNLMPVEYELKREEFFDVLDRARMGKLTEGELLRPVRLDPVVWELRLGYSGGLYRLYFAEPESDTEILVALRFHEKSLDGTDDEIDAAQELEMDEAIDRLAKGEHNRWGWPP